MGVAVWGLVVGPAKLTRLFPRPRGARLPPARRGCSFSDPVSPPAQGRSVRPDGRPAPAGRNRPGVGAASCKRGAFAGWCPVQPGLTGVSAWRPARMQERRGQLGRGLGCLLAANGPFWGNRPKNDAHICPVRDDLARPKGNGRGVLGGRPPNNVRRRSVRNSAASPRPGRVAAARPPFFTGPP